MRFVFVVLLLLLACSLAYADDYTVTGTITDDEFAVTEAVVPGGDEFVYAVAPGDFKVFTVMLSGSALYTPWLDVYDPDEEEFITKLEGNPGDVLSYSYVSGMDGREPREYYFVVNGLGDTGQQFTFSYAARGQDDAGIGEDAPARFVSSELIVLGEHAGELGDEDEKDSFSLEMHADESFTFTLTPADKGLLGLSLVDGSGFEKIDKSGMLEDEVLTASYDSLREQTAYLTVSGDVPYTLLIESDREEEDVAPPPAPPAPPADEPLTVADSATPGEDSSALDLQGDQEQRQRSGSLVVALVVVLVLGAGVLFYFVWLKKQ
ncbi:hypothetical protein GF367_03140 [Candidatus Woesearchaeota archaeon]|nr:hypothetical protein [Candidatus Woesearchaeota archaeon]